MLTDALTIALALLTAACGTGALLILLHATAPAVEVGPEADMNTLLDDGTVELRRVGRHRAPDPDDPMVRLAAMTDHIRDRNHDMRTTLRALNSGRWTP